MDLLAHLTPAVDRPVAIELLDGDHRAVERNPRHHLRVSEVAAWPTYLPDALVRLVPAPLERLEHHLLQRPGGLVPLELRGPRLVQHVEHLAVDVELELVARAVADPHRLRALVAFEPRQLELGQAPLPGGPVHDLEVVGIAGDGPQQPLRQARASSMKPQATSAFRAKVASRSQQ